MSSWRLSARYWRIVVFYGRATAGFIFWEIVMRRIGLGRWSDRTGPDRYRGIARRFRAMAVKMGGLMIKVGQFLSARLDVLPPEITEELADLQDEVPPESFDDLRKVAEADMRLSLAEHYEWFDETPLAAASLGQAHRARLCPDDATEQGFTDVVVKIQRPHIEQIVETDLSALRRVAGWLRRYKPISDRADVRALVEEFANITRAEIDYVAEGHNAETFAENFADDPQVHVPKVVWSLTTRRVLTLEDVYAIKISDYDVITAAGIDRSEVASVLLDTYMQQILDDGFFHADPHPGNLFVTPVPGAMPGEEQGWKLTFVDFGMVGHVPDNARTGLRELLVSVGTQDAPRLVASLKTLGVLLPGADLNLVERAVGQVFERFWGMSMADLRQIDHSEMMQLGLQFRDLMVEMPFQLPEDLLLFGRTLAILSGMCTGLDPEFNLWSAIAPYANDLIAEEGTTGLQTFLAEATRIFQILVALPGRTDRVLTTMERGELAVRTPLLELRVRRLERSVGRVSGAVVFAALLVAGAILYPADVVLARILMVVSLVPLAWLVFGGRGHGPRG